MFNFNYMISQGKKIKLQRQRSQTVPARGRGQEAEGRKLFCMTLQVQMCVTAHLPQPTGHIPQVGPFTQSVDFS